MRNRFLWLLLIGLSASSYAQTQAAGPSLTVDATKKVSPVSQKLYGLMTEEINHAYDGGLYAEMVSNRTFRRNWAGFEEWIVVRYGSASIELSEAKDGPSKALSSSIQIEVKGTAKGGVAGIANDGYWGMAVRPSTSYSGSFYAKTDKAKTAKIALVSDLSGEAVAKAEVTIDGDGWKQYKFVMKSGAAVKSSSRNHLEITFGQDGVVQMQLVSIFPPTYHNRENGNRPDLMVMMAGMNPHFLRFPGGNYLEGDHIRDRFNWKETIGPLVDRPTHQGTWSYHSSDGLGLLEFLEWCEDLHIEPVLAVYAGYSLSSQQVTGKDLDPFIQEDLDEIEYVTGDTSTKWGAVRAQNGHPEPFALHYIEIGNEDFVNAKAQSTYDERFSRIADAIREKYSNRFALIATTTVKEGHPDLIDDHYYKSPDEFFAMDKKYDAYPRSGPKIFIGEWATRTGSPTPDFGAALGDAAFMTSMERNSDLIEIASYAPLLTNVNPGAMQWPVDLIGYTADKVYASPSYWAQVLFSHHLGDYTVATAGTGLNDRFFWSATVSDEKKVLYLKLVNASNEAQPLNLEIPGAKTGQGSVETLHAETRYVTNSIEQPDVIHPVSSEIKIGAGSIHHPLAANTIEIITVPLK